MPPTNQDRYGACSCSPLMPRISDVLDREAVWPPYYAVVNRHEEEVIRYI